MVTQRVTQLATIAKYGARKFAMGLQGKGNPLAEVYDIAWFQSSRKKLPTVSLEEVFPGSTNLSIRLDHSLPKATGNLTMDELVVMALTCQWLKPSVVFEIGTFNGRTTLNLAANSPADTKIYTLDLEDPAAAQLSADKEDADYHLLKQSGNYFHGTEFSKKIEQLWCDSARFDEANFRGLVDLVFVDGAHSYDYVRSDTIKALAMVRQGGAILWHDYCAWYPGVYDYLHEILPKHELKHIQGTHFAVLRN
ncbi:MAG: class I SAM-dependent methyltransferase [Terracidiphilus sp.]